jgi:hypothetical protein
LRLINREAAFRKKATHKSIKMKIDFLTREDLKVVEVKINEVLLILQASKSYGSNEIYTTENLAKKLSVSTKTVQLWRKSKLIEFSQIHNKIFYTEEAVMRFLLAHSVKRRSSLLSMNHSNQPYGK